MKTKVKIFSLLVFLVITLLIIPGQKAKASVIIKGASRVDENGIMYCFCGANSNLSCGCLFLDPSPK